MPPGKQYVSGTGNAKNLSSVAQTCNQLSLFLKDKGGCLKDVHFGINSKFDDSVKSGPPMSTIDLLSNMENSSDDRTPSKTRWTTKPTMTIFYKGQVMVVDDISEDRAKEVFNLAATNSPAAATLLLSSNHKAPKVAAADLGSNNNQRRRIDEHAQLQPPNNNGGLDLPIARRASLHKFLAKRKDRANLRPDPYPLLLPNNNNHHHPSSSGKHHFDLNL
uniref:protein TIFY 10B-like n=1 Tax=Erigeron canadensis TaxID=72917 RepID=UPI001CB90A53|nr:protein TIFY 10B-like [Erigeron canadensis]